MTTLPAQSFALIDHRHRFTTDWFDLSVYGGTPSAIDPDDAGQVGTAATLARSDHQHQATAGTPVSVTTVNAEGAGTTWARNNHEHGVAVPAVRAIWSANTSVTSGTDTKIAFGGADAYDTNAMHDPVTLNTRITLPVAGVYSFGTWFQFTTAAGGYRTGFIAPNNGGAAAALAVGPRLLVSGAAVDVVTMSAEAKFAANDYIEVYAFQDSGGAINVTGGAFWASYQTAG